MPRLTGKDQCPEEGDRDHEGYVVCKVESWTSFEQLFFLHERAMMAVKLQECSRSLGPAGRSLA